MDGLDTPRTPRDSTATQERKEPGYNELLMTLNDLIRKASDMARQLSSGDVPLVCETIPVNDMDFEFRTDEDGEQYVHITLW